MVELLVFIDVLHFLLQSHNGATFSFILRIRKQNKFILLHRLGVFILFVMPILFHYPPGSFVPFTLDHLRVKKN